MLIALLFGCFGGAPQQRPPCDDLIVGRASSTVGGVEVVCGKVREIDRRPGGVLGTLGGLSIRQNEQAVVRICEDTDSAVVSVYGSIAMQSEETFHERVVADLTGASDGSFRTIEPTGEVVRGKGRLFGQEVDQVTTPVSLMGMPRTQLVRGTTDGNKACMVSVVYDPTVITDPAVLEPLFAAPK